MVLRLRLVRILDRLEFSGETFVERWLDFSIIILGGREPWDREMVQGKEEKAAKG